MAGYRFMLFPLEAEPGRLAIYHYKALAKFMVFLTLFAVIIGNWIR